MMKLLLSLTLIWALSSTGEALVCETCTNATCSATAPVTCSTETMCITASIQAVSSGTPGQQIYKACAPPSLCPATGSQTFSVNLGVSSALANATCCSTDNCNSNTLPFPVVPANNSLQCHVCKPVTFDCNSSIQCRGTEDRCFEATVTNGDGASPAFGCASTNQCAAAASLGSLPFMQSVGSITSGPACCGTSFCNSLTTNSTIATTTNAPTTTTPTTTTTTPTTTTTIPITTTTTPTTTTTTPITTTTTPTTNTPTTTTTTPATTTTPTTTITFPATTTTPTTTITFPATTTTPTTTITFPATSITPTTATTAPGPAAIIYLKVKITTSGELSIETITEHVNQFLRTTLLNSTAFTVNVKSIQRVRVATTTTTTTRV